MKSIDLFSWVRSAALATAVLCGGAAQAVVGGTATSNFKAVGPTMGIQVTPDWVITALHVTLPVGATYTNGYGNRTVAAEYRLPGAGVFPLHDIALLRLVPAATTAPYLEISSTLFPEGTFSPVPVTIVSGANPFGRGYAFNTISEFSTLNDPDDAGPLPPVIANYLISYNSTVYVEGGDSGGGLFFGNVLDAVSPLLGITSARLEDENLVPIGSAFVEISAYRAWIDATMAADLTDTQVLNWVSVVPEPATVLLWSLGALAVAGRARRARVTH